MFRGLRFGVCWLYCVWLVCVCVFVAFSCCIYWLAFDLCGCTLICACCVEYFGFGLVFDCVCFVCEFGLMFGLLFLFVGVVFCFNFD